MHLFGVGFFLFFFNRIITADISAHVRFYYIFVVILQALNFGPQLSWQSSLKTSVLSYCPSSAPAESWRLKMLQCRVLFATEKVLIPEPNSSVNIYCLHLSTGPTPVGLKRHPGARPFSSRKPHICPQARQLLSSTSRRHAGGSTLLTVVTKSQPQSPVSAEGHPLSCCLQVLPAATRR